jgi:hypothetical protein
MTHHRRRKSVTRVRALRGTVWLSATLNSADYLQRPQPGTMSQISIHTHRCRLLQWDLSGLALFRSRNSPGQPVNRSPSLASCNRDQFTAVTPVDDSVASLIICFYTMNFSYFLPYSFPTLMISIDTSSQAFKATFLEWHAQIIEY